MSCCTHLEDPIRDYIEAHGLTKTLTLKMDAVEDLGRLLELLATNVKHIVVVVPSNTAVSVANEVKNKTSDSAVVVYSSIKLKDEVMIAF